jgi:hypothetical protein
MKDDPDRAGGDAPKSFGKMSEHHWSKARADLNREAIDYYRERSRAPGVAAGGTERNFYCMKCDGVIPYDHPGSACPHCGESFAGMARRYFNWVEINEPPGSGGGAGAKSDFRALLPFAAAGLLALVVVAVAVVWLLS